MNFTKNIFNKIKAIKFSKKQRLTIGIWCLIIGVLIVSSNYLLERKNSVYEEMTFSLSTIEQPETIEDTTNPVPDEEINDTTTTVDGDDVFVNQDYFVGRIEIPKIKLIKGFAAINSPQNNVNKNVAIIEGSTYPDVEKGNFILAAHTGTAWNCFFRNLYKLANGDVAYVYYNGYKYTYQVSNIYTVQKTGMVKIYRNNKKTSLTLITCTIHSNDKQSVFVFDLISKEVA